MNRPYYFTTDFLSKMMSNHSGKQIVVSEASPFSLDNSASILAVLTAGNSTRPIGHFGLNITYKEDQRENTLDAVLKIKPHGNEITAMLNGLAAKPKTNLEKVYDEFQSETGFRNVHRRELEVHEKLKPSCAQEVYGTHADEESGLYFILMESLLETEKLNTVMQPGLWKDDSIKEVLNSMAKWHIEGQQAHQILNQQYWDDVADKVYMIRLVPLWEELLNQASNQFPELYTEERQQIMQSFIKDLPRYWSELASMPKTLVHNDCNPRNMCFKGPENKLCLYDWELSTYHTPVYDIVEFLSFALEEDRYDQWPVYLKYYFETLESLGNPYKDEKQFKRAVKLSARDFGLHRLGMYMMAHAVAPYPFLPRVVNSYFHLLSLEL
ncbi:MAG: phosphotransferase [Reichenbachiella sp.]